MDSAPQRKLIIELDEDEARHLLVLLTNSEATIDQYRWAGVEHALNDNQIIALDYRLFTEFEDAFRNYFSPEDV